MFNVPASARQARLRSVPWQPNFQKKQNQENSRSSLPLSFSPCSLIKSTKTVSEMLAQRADALSHANPTASSKRLLKGALLGSCGTFSTLPPHCGQHTRYTSMITVVRYSPHGKSRTSRSLQ